MGQPHTHYFFTLRYNNIENLKDVGMNIAAEEVNEYAKSRADLVIRRDEGYPVKVCGVWKHSEVDEALTGMVAGSLPIWECFRNMSGTGTAISMEYLGRGIIINKVVIYGIVVWINDLNHAKLIRLEMNFELGECKFIMDFWIWFVTECCGFCSVAYCITF